MKIDLQTQSTCSDGHDTPTEIVKMCAEAGVRLAAVTDHDTTKGVPEALEAGKRFGIPVVPGIEFTTVLRGNTLHVLGYGFDIANRDIQALCDELTEDRKRVFVAKLRSINGRLAEEGKKQFDIDDFIRAQGAFFGLGKFLDYVTQQGIFGTRAEALTYWKESKREIMTRIEPRDAIAALHAAGGIAVVSHPLGPKTSLKGLTKDFDAQKHIIEELKAQGLDGLECYTPSHFDEDITKAVTLAREFNLLITVGSDWHGNISILGEQIRSYIPNYPQNLGDLEAPDAVGQQLLERFGIR